MTGPIEVRVWRSRDDEDEAPALGRPGLPTQTYTKVPRPMAIAHLAEQQAEDIFLADMSLETLSFGAQVGDDPPRLFIVNAEWELGMDSYMLDEKAPE